MEIYKRLATICKAVEAIKKDKTNQQQNFKYRGIDQVLNQLHDLFAENDVVITSQIVSTTREERVNSKGTTLIWSIIDYTFVFSTTDGSSITTTVRGEAMDSGDKGSNKCYSVALKYALFGMFLIPTEEMNDPDSQSHTVKEEVQLPELTPKHIKWNSAVIAVRSGQYKIDDVLKKYTMTPATLAQFEQEVINLMKEEAAQ